MPLKLMFQDDMVIPEPKVQEAVAVLAGAVVAVPDEEALHLGDLEIAVDLLPGYDDILVGYSSVLRMNDQSGGVSENQKMAP